MQHGRAPSDAALDHRWPSLIQINGDTLSCDIFLYRISHKHAHVKGDRYDQCFRNPTSSWSWFGN